MWYFCLPTFLLTLVLHVQGGLPHEHGKIGSIVDFLPGFDGPLPFNLQTGYIGVGKSEEVQLFYYFVESESDPKKDPVLLWLTGGPGCSSFTGLAYEIGIEAGNEPLINLKGYSLGNPVTFPEQSNYQIQFSHGMGLISDELYESLKRTCKGEYRNIGPSNELCLQHVNMYNKLVSGINDQHILEPLCGSDTEIPNLRQRRSLHEEDLVFLKQLDDDFICQESRVAKRKLSNYWANDPRVQEALHVRKGRIGRPWARCRQFMTNATYFPTFWNSIPYHVNLSTKSYRSLIYSGDHDMGIPFQSTQAWIKYLNYSINDDWRPWSIDDQVAGYTRSYTNHMTFATVKGGGHTAPEYKREECFHMFKRWIAQQPL
ncbi:hypothetical protein HAX54_051141 [Datura stramonium]|uniref:Uncharacterized protein n=1 Tax=Datura stramonium TaxID=4076 RepID=A0ABS8WM29_DATST|nr:hypothetical protein [Datura stramonium]